MRPSSLLMWSASNRDLLYNFVFFFSFSSLFQCSVRWFLLLLITSCVCVIFLHIENNAYAKRDLFQIALSGFYFLFQDYTIDVFLVNSNFTSIWLVEMCWNWLEHPIYRYFFQIVIVRHIDKHSNTQYSKHSVAIQTTLKTNEFLPSWFL